MKKIRVLIVDDAVVVRQILTRLLESEPDIEVAGTAANGRIALSKITQINPDLVTLDVEMPDMDGLTTLKEIRKILPKLPVIMFSTLTERGAGATMDALAAGASDYVTKPANVGSVGVAMSRIKEQLIPKIKALAAQPDSSTRPLPLSARLSATPTAAAAKAATNPPTPLRPTTPSTDIEAIAIGVSTGGPNALSVVIPQLPGNLRMPVFITQHMPPMFTKLLADRLGTQSTLKVCEASPGQKVLPGNVYIAPGDFHMTVQRRADGVFIATNKDLPENSCRPAVDVMFRSIAKAYGSKVLAAILTGMGSDGLRGCEVIHDAGGRIIVQDEATSIVWGMPGFVAQAGLAEKVLPLDRIAAEMIRMTSSSAARPLAIAG